MSAVNHLHLPISELQEQFVHCVNQDVTNVSNLGYSNEVLAYDLICVRCMHWTRTEKAPQTMAQNNVGST